MSDEEPTDTEEEVEDSDMEEIDAFDEFAEESEVEEEEEPEETGVFEMTEPVDYTTEVFNQFENNSEYINTYHPEEVHLSFEEMYNLTIITRNEQGRIEDELHQTYPILSKYEKAKIIGLRVVQLNRGAPSFIQNDHLILDKHILAEEELKQKKIPFILKRPLPNGAFEYWNLKDLELL
jgi:DNA-directed RNA polymerases I, II, and III subunit RPABC2